MSESDTLIKRVLRFGFLPNHEFQTKDSVLADFFST